LGIFTYRVCRARVITAATFSTVRASNPASHTRDRRSASEITTPVQRVEQQGSGFP
jgi:hypothetical protein